MAFLSMTGFGVAGETFETERGRIQMNLEVKTVNSKFLDSKIRLPKVYAAYEQRIQQVLKSKLKRGRVEVAFFVFLENGKSQEIIVNVEQAKAVQAGLAKVVNEVGLASQVTLQDMLSIPNWIEAQDVLMDEEEEWKRLEPVLLKALEKVIKAREEEGSAIMSSIKNHLKVYADSFNQLKAANDEILSAYRKRTQERIEEALQKTEVDKNRLEQEVTFWVARNDYREEIDRIDHHIKTFEDLFEQTTEAGRRMEFVSQELLRETNTLGSKCADPKFLPQIVEMKSSLERIREQALNVE